MNDHEMLETINKEAFLEIVRLNHKAWSLLLYLVPVTLGMMVFAVSGLLFLSILCLAAMIVVLLLSIEAKEKAQELSERMLFNIHVEIEVKEREE